MDKKKLILTIITFILFIIVFILAWMLFNRFVIKTSFEKEVLSFARKKPKNCL